jgi:hypothetical protein
LTFQSRMRCRRFRSRRTEWYGLIGANRIPHRRRSERLKLLRCPSRAACARADFARLRLLPAGAGRETRRSMVWLAQVGQAGVSEKPISSSTTLSHSAQWKLKRGIAASPIRRIGRRPSFRFYDPGDGVSRSDIARYDGYVRCTGQCRNRTSPSRSLPRIAAVA